MFRTISLLSYRCFSSLHRRGQKSRPRYGRRADGSGMSVVGNDEAPKSLVIVPWKSSELGDMLDVSRALDDGRQPVDRDVFNRQLDYYQIRLAPAAMRVSEKQ